MKCTCGRDMLYQPALFDYQGYYICVCGEQTERPAKQTPARKKKVIDYGHLQEQLLYYKTKLIMLDKQIQEQGQDHSLVEERTWCNLQKKWIEPELGLLGFTQEDYIAQ